MSMPDTKARAALAALIAELLNSRPNLGTPQGQRDYRTLLLTQNAHGLLDLPDLDPDAAVFLYHLVLERTAGLLKLQLITAAESKDLIDELLTLYGNFRPELLPRVLTPTEPAPDA